MPYHHVYSFLHPHLPLSVHSDLECSGDVVVQSDRVVNKQGSADARGDEEDAAHKCSNVNLLCSLGQLGPLAVNRIGVEVCVARADVSGQVQLSDPCVAHESQLILVGPTVDRRCVLFGDGGNNHVTFFLCHVNLHSACDALSFGIMFNDCYKDGVANSVMEKEFRRKRSTGVSPLLVICDMEIFDLLIIS